jgi:diguanylate cyclase (GGDEF)-like protein/PAS domain S-box-containing protein
MLAAGPDLLSLPHLLAGLVLLAGSACAALLAPQALAHGRRGWLWAVGVGGAAGVSLWASQVIALLSAGVPEGGEGCARLAGGLVIAFGTGVGMFALARADMLLAAALVLGAGALGAQLVGLTSVVPADALVFPVVALGATLGASLGAGLLAVGLAWRTLVRRWPWRFAAGTGGALALAISQRAVLQFQAERLPSADTASLWIAAALAAAALALAAFVLLVAVLESRLETHARAAQVELDETRVRLEREALQRRELAAAHAESEERFRSAFDEAAVGMSLLGADLRWIRVNRAFCEFLGYPAEELVRLGFAGVTHPDDVEATRAGLRRLAAGEVESFSIRKRYLTAAGEMVYGDLHASVARRERGAPKEFVAQVLDVTSRVRVEAELADSEARFRSAFEDASVPMALVGARAENFGRFVRVNGAMCELLGYTAEDLLRLDTARLVASEDLERIVADAQRTLGEGALQVETRCLHRSGRTVWVRFNMSLVRDAAGAPAYFVGQYEDITARKQALEDLERANAELARRIADQEQQARGVQLLGDYGQLLHACTELGEAYRIVARFGPRLLGASAGHLYITAASRDYLEHASGWGQAPGAPALCAMDECWALRRGQPHRAGGGAPDPTCPHAEGRSGTVSLCLPLVAQNDTLGLLWIEFPGVEPSQVAIQLASAFADRLAPALANLRLRETLRDQSVRDQLTGLYNRRFFEESLARELARAARAGRAVALMMLDVDHFKRFNDTHGHDAGDNVLRGVAAALAARLRTSDVLCRYGGEEFVALMPEITPGTVLERAEQLRAGVAGLPVPGVPGAGPITISVGVALYPQHGSDARTLVRTADQALYAAKGAGRNGVVVAEAPAAMVGHA